MKTGSLPRRLAGLARRFLRHERGSISPLFTLMLIPICGVLAMAVELGNGALQQRTQQHAADSAALAAAIGNNTTCYNSSGTTSASVSMSTSGATGGNCITTSSGALNASYTPGYQLEAKAVAASFTSITGATVSPGMDYCPGTTSGNFDCYKVTITRTTPTFLSQVIGVRSLTPTAVAYANTGSVHDDCFVGTGYDTGNSREVNPAKTGDAIYLNGSNNLGQCWAATGGGTVSCSGSVHFAGVAAPNSSTCGDGYQKSTFSDAARESAVSADISSLPSKATMATNCSSNINSLNWVDSGSGYQYAYMSSAKCGGNSTNTVMAGNVSLSDSTTTASRVLILDGVGMDTAGNALTATSAAGTTIIATASGGASTTALGQKYSGSQDIIYSSTKGGSVDIRAPVTGTFANYAIIGDPTYQGVSALDDSKNNNEINFSVLGIIFVPYSDIFLDSSNNSYFNAIGTCMSIVANTIQGSGGKLSAALTTSCQALGYTTPTSLFSVIALVK